MAFDLTATISIGGGLIGGLDAGDSSVVVGLEGRLYAVDVATRVVLGSLLLGDAVKVDGVTASADGSKMYVTASFGGTFVIEGMAVTGTISGLSYLTGSSVGHGDLPVERMVVSDGHLFVPAGFEWYSGWSQVAVADLASNVIVGLIDLSGIGVIADEGSAVRNRITLVDAVTPQWHIGEVGLPGVGTGGSRALMTTNQGLAVIDTIGYSGVALIPTTGGPPTDVAVIGTKAYAASNSAIDVIDLTSNTVIDTVSTGYLTAVVLAFGSQVVVLAVDSAGDAIMAVLDPAALWPPVQVLTLATHSGPDHRCCPVDAIVVGSDIWVSISNLYFAPMSGSVVVVTSS